MSSNPPCRYDHTKESGDPCALLDNLVLLYFVDFTSPSPSASTLYQKEEDAALRELAAFKEKEGMVDREIKLMHSRMSRVMKQLDQVILLTASERGIESDQRSFKAARRFKSLLDGCEQTDTPPVPVSRVSSLSLPPLHPALPLGVCLQANEEISIYKGQLTAAGMSIPESLTMGMLSPLINAGLSPLVTPSASPSLPPMDPRPASTSGRPSSAS